VRYLRHLLHDFIEIYIVALVAACLPERLGARVVWAGAGLYRFHPDIHQPQAAFTSCWPGRVLNDRELRWNYLIEASTAWRLILRRKLSVEHIGQWPEKPGFIVAGAHYGNGIIMLWSLYAAGLRPRFMLRAPEKKLLRYRPALWPWSLLRFRLIKRLCPDGVVLTGGALNSLQSILEEGQTTPVVLFDTPAPPHHSDWTLDLGQCAVCLYTGAARIIAKHLDHRHVPVVYFKPDTRPGQAGSRLHIQCLDASQWTHQCCSAISDSINQQPEGWLFWPNIEPHLMAASRKHDPHE